MPPSGSPEFIIISASRTLPVGLTGGWRLNHSAATASDSPARASSECFRMAFCPGQSATFDGKSFGTVGQYEKIRGTAFGELNPLDPHNAVITDIALAPRNARGNVTCRAFSGIVF